MFMGLQVMERVKLTVGGVAKVAVHQEIACDNYFANAEEVVSFLDGKFSEKEYPRYYVKEIASEDVEALRRSATHLVFKTVDGSSAFHIIIFTPGVTNFKAANCYCICPKCKMEFGSCSLFDEYQLNVETIHPAVVRSEKLGPVAEEEEDCLAEEFVIPESIVAVAVAQNSLDTVWFIKVTETECFSAELVTDDCKHVIPLGRSYLKGHFLERLSLL